MAVSVVYLMHLGSSLLLKRGTDYACSSVSRQLGSFCPISQDPCISLSRRLCMLQLHASLRMICLVQILVWICTRQIQTLFSTFCLQGPLGTSLRLSRRQLLEAQPKCLSNGESFEFRSNCRP